MNCPKCGNYIEDNKDYCFMCGTKIGNSDFSSPGRNDVNPSLNEEYYRKKEEYNNRLNNYRDVEIKRVKDDKRDFIDFYTEYKVFFKVGGYLILVVIAVVVFLLVAKGNNKDEVLKPIVQNLYYKVDSKMTNTGNNNGTYVYSLSNNKGTSCSISVGLDNSNSSDHVKEYFEAKEALHAPTYDENGDVLDTLSIPLYQQGTITINNVEWYYLNTFYRKGSSEPYTSLKYRFFSVGHNGLFYNVELANYDDLAECNALQDGFLRSLKFIDE